MIHKQSVCDTETDLWHVSVPTGHKSVSVSQSVCEKVANSFFCIQAVCLYIGAQT